MVYPCNNAVTSYELLRLINDELAMTNDGLCLSLFSIIHY